MGLKRTAKGYLRALIDTAKSNFGPRFALDFVDPP